MPAGPIANLENQFISLGRWIERHPLWWFASLSILLHILRQPIALIHPQFWAEDGKIFFYDDYMIGPAAFLKTYAGYLHFWPRTGAFVLGFLPTLWLPFFYKLFALGTHGLLLAVIANRRFPGDHLQKAVMMLLIALVPHNGEAFLNLANSISFCCLIMSAICISQTPLRLSNRILEMVGLFVLACSGAYIFFVFPLALVLFFFRSIKANALRIVGLTAGLILQMAYFTIKSRSENLEIQPEIAVWAGAIKVTLKGLVFAKVPFPSLLEWILAALVMGALLISFWPAIKDLFFKCRDFSSSLFLLAVGVANLAASMWIGRMFLEVIDPYGGASRYFFLSYILILWALVLDWNLNRHSLLRKYLVLSSIFFSLMNFNSMMAKKSLNWAGQVKELEETGRVEMHVLPPRPGWIFEVNSHGAWRADQSSR